MVVYGLAPSQAGDFLGAGEVVGRIRAGLPMAEFFALRELLDATGEELAERLGMSRSTWARRKQSGRLSVDESDRLVRYARLFGRAEQVVGASDAARDWLRTANRAFGFIAPLDYASTEAGAREIENLLGRIEHGVFS